MVDGWGWKVGGGLVRRAGSGLGREWVGDAVVEASGAGKGWGLDCVEGLEGG